MQSQRVFILAQLPTIIHPRDPACATTIVELHYATNYNELSELLQLGLVLIGKRRMQVCYHTHEDGHQ